MKAAARRRRQQSSLSAGCGGGGVAAKSYSWNYDLNALSETLSSECIFGNANGFKASRRCIKPVGHDYKAGVGSVSRFMNLKEKIRPARFVTYTLRNKLQ